MHLYSKWAYILGGLISEIISLLAYIQGSLNRGGALTWDSTIPDWLRDRWIDDFIILINSSIQRQRTARNNQRKRTNKKR